MQQNDKQLLLKDLCARLPYGVRGVHRDRVHYLMNVDWGFGTPSIQVDGYDAWFSIDTFKPYLRSMSSMTEKEENEYRAINCYEGVFPSNEDALDYALEHHLDFRNLIEKGLALEAPKDMYKTK